MKVMKKIAFCIFIAIAYLYWQDNGIMITKYLNHLMDIAYYKYRIYKIKHLENIIKNWFL